MNEKPWKPTKKQLSDALGKKVPDVIAHDLKILFCGINPSLYTAAVGHHFARPGNRFWPVLYKSGFTPRLYSPFEEHLLLKSGYGITNVVNAATASAADLSKDQIRKGGEILIKKIFDFHPRVLAILGVGAYREAFNKTDAKIGPQDSKIGDTFIWTLPNPSGLNASYQMNMLVQLFRELYDFVNRPSA